MLIDRVLPAAVLGAMSAAAAAAQGGGFDPQQLYFGGGISQNEVAASDEGTGYQLFAGYRFGELARNIRLDAEAGYLDTGDMEVRVGPPPFGGARDVRAKGLWATGVVRFILNPQAELLTRAGLDFGDDDGLMVGLGVGFNLSPQVQMRFEYVERDNVDSFQVNFAFKP